MSSEQLEKTKHQFLPKEMNKLYHKGTVPERLKNKGQWILHCRKGGRCLCMPGWRHMPQDEWKRMPLDRVAEKDIWVFSPFGGVFDDKSNLIRFDWKCNVCGWLAQWSVIKGFKKYKCPNCGNWARRW